MIFIQGYVNIRALRWFQVIICIVLATLYLLINKQHSTIATADLCIFKDIDGDMHSSVHTKNKQLSPTADCLALVHL